MSITQPLTQTPVQTVDPRIVRTRRLLIDAFVELMGEKPFDEISISEITQRATVNRATFYSHFADKHELADEFIREGFEKAIRAKVTGTEPDVRAYMGQLFRAASEHRRTVHSECRIKAHSLEEMRKFEASTDVEMRAMLRDNIHRWISEHAEAKSISDKANNDMMASMISSALYAAVVHFNVNKQLKDNGTDIESIVDHIARMLD